MTKPVDGRISLILREKREYLSTSIISAYFTRIRIAVQLREHAQIPTRPARLLAAIPANSLRLRQSTRWQQLAQSSWRNQSWVLRISTAIWMRWESLYRKNDFTRLYRVRRWYLIIQLLSYYLYAACTFMQGYLMTDMAILMLHKNVSRETSDSDDSIHLANQLPSSRRELP